MSTPSLSRRQFMGVAGGLAGAMALASLNFDAPAQINKPKISADDFKQDQREVDVLVIGGGMAGLFAAVKAHDAGARVLMVSKGRVGSSGLTPFAKGIFSYDRKKASMSIDDFVAKVSESAIQTNNPVFTRQLAEHSYDRVQELKSWGFFDSPIYHESFMRPINERRISVDERIMITHLLKEDGRVVGASGFMLDEKRIIHYLAKSVIPVYRLGRVQTQRFSRLRPYPRRHHHGLQGRRQGNRQGVERRPSGLGEKLGLQLRQLAWSGRGKAFDDRSDDQPSPRR